MTLTRVKTANQTIAEVAECGIVLLAAIGSDSKPYLLKVDEAGEQLLVATSGAAVLVREKVFHNYATTNVTTAAYVQLIASTSAKIKKISIFDSSGSVMILATGGAGSETDFCYVQPGGGDVIEHEMAAGTRLSVKAASANATLGYLVINAWS